MCAPLTQTKLLHHSGSEHVATFTPLDRDAGKWIDANWWVNLPSIRAKEPDHHWKWAKLPRSYETSAEHRLFTICNALRTNDNRIQGAIIYRLNGKSYLCKDEGAVFIEWLATAPYNRPRLKNPPVYQGAGTALLLQAMAASELSGFRGRVVLCTVDHADTIEYYKRRGFTAIPGDEDGTMEIESEKARAFLRNHGIIE